jgi:hypothetical protein
MITTLRVDRTGDIAVTFVQAARETKTLQEPEHDPFIWNIVCETMLPICIPSGMLYEKADR